MTKLYRVLGKRGRITIPYEIRQRVGFSYNDVLSFTEASDGRTVTVKREKICDNCSKPAEKDNENDAGGFSRQPLLRAAVGGACASVGEMGAAKGG